MFLTLMWLCVAAGMVTIISAAMREQGEGVCKGYDIKIEGFKTGMLFTSKDQIAGLLKSATKGNVTGQKKSVFNLPMIEDLLEQSSWVYNADLYFDNNDILHANVTERKPLARVFTNTGQSFYIDEAGKHIPLSDKVSLDLPVFTGYPSKKIMNAADSTLIENVIATASFINTDSFWNAQVAQIDIRNCGADCWSMEMIPVVGNHKVELGDGSDIASKFHRLYLFYDQVLKRTGFDKYQKIDVEYNGQVIGIKGNYTKVDSLQLRKNIEDLLVQSRASNEMLEVAPSVGYTATMQSDTSTEAKNIYTSNEEPADSVLYQQDNVNEERNDNGKKDEAVTKPATPAVTINKASTPKPKNLEADKNKNVKAATNELKANPKKPPVKKEEAKKTEVKKIEKPQPVTTKKLAASDKKIEPKKTVEKKTLDKAPATENVKRNLLAKPEPEKKKEVKKAIDKKPEGKNPQKKTEKKPEAKKTAIKKDVTKKK